MDLSIRKNKLARHCRPMLGRNRTAPKNKFSPCDNWGGKYLFGVIGKDSLEATVLNLKDDE